MRLITIPLLLVTAAAAANLEPTLLAGHTAAVKANKPLVLFLFQVRNRDCERLEREGLPAARGFDAVFAKQNASVDDASGNVARILADHAVTSFPTVLVFTCTKTGVTEKGRITGYSGASDFVGKLGRILGQRAAAPAANSIPEMLRAKGYSFKADANGSYRVDVSRDGRKWFVKVFKAADVTWVYAPLVRRDKLLRAGSDRLVKLLEKSWEFGPMHFECDSAMLKLSLPLAAEALDANKLSTAIDKVVQNMAATESLWNVK